MNVGTRLRRIQVKLAQKHQGGLLPLGPATSAGLDGTRGAAGNDRVPVSDSDARSH